MTVNHHASKLAKPPPLLQLPQLFLAMEVALVTIKKELSSVIIHSAAQEIINYAAKSLATHLVDVNQWE